MVVFKHFLIPVLDKLPENIQYLVLGNSHPLSSQELQGKSEHYYDNFLWRYERHAAVIKVSTWRTAAAAARLQFVPTCGYL